jgi:hypothetical protein
MDYEAVFWDVGGVILHIGSIDEAQTAFLERAIERYGLPSDVGEARERWRDAMRAHFAGREGRAYRTAREARAKAAAALFDGDEPISGNVTDRLDLYDAGTEQDARPGHGPKEPPGPVQKPVQDPMATDVGTDEGVPIRLAEERHPEFDIPDASEVIEVTITPQ